MNTNIPVYSFSIPTVEQAKVRRGWGSLNPMTRVRGSKKAYDRNKARLDFRKRLSDQE